MASTRMVLRPSLAAVSAAMMPAAPLPTTQMSASTFIWSRVFVMTRVARLSAMSCLPGCCLVDADAAALHDRDRFLRLALHKGAKFIARHVERLETEVGKALGHLGLLHRIGDLFVQPLRDGRWR